MNQAPIRVFLVDDHPIVRDGIRRLIELQNDMTVCGETGNGDEVLQCINRLEPHIVILDLSIEGMDGFSLISHIKSRHPDTPVLILSIHNEEVYALRTLQAGAKGYLMKKCAPTDIEKAIRKILSGSVYTSEAIKEKLINQIGRSDAVPRNELDLLSKRELQIFRLYGEGFRTTQIAEKLSCSVKTVETHTLRIRRKLSLNSLSEMIVLASSFVTPAGVSFSSVTPRN